MIAKVNTFINLYRTGTIVRKLDPETGHTIPGIYEFGTIIAAAYEDSPEGRKLYYKIDWGLNQIEYCDIDQIDMR